MAEGKKSFIAYTDWKDTFDALTDEKAGALIKHIYAYVSDENPETDDMLIKAVFANIKNTLKRDLKKWENQQEQRVKAGKKSAEIRQQNATLVNARSNSSTVSDNVNVSVNQKKADVFDFDVYKNKIAEEGNTVWLEGIYMTYKLKPKTFSFVVDDFILHLKCQDESKHPKNLKDFKKYLYNWCNRIEPEGKLNQYKKNQPKQNGQL